MCRQTKYFNEGYDTMAEADEKWTPYTDGKWQGRPVIGWREALAAARANNEVLVGIDDVIQRWSGEAAHVLHIMAPHDYYKSKSPTAFAVELVRPRWLYGAEGLMHSDGLRYIGHLDIDYEDGFESELTSEEQEAFPDDGDVWGYRDTAPAWRDKPIEWRRITEPWWQFFRDLPAADHSA